MLFALTLFYIRGSEKTETVAKSALFADETLFQTNDNLFADETLFQTNDNGRLAPLTCHEYSTVLLRK